MSAPGSCPSSEPRGRRGGGVGTLPAPAGVTQRLPGTCLLTGTDTLLHVSESPWGRHGGGGCGFRTVPAAPLLAIAWSCPLYLLTVRLCLPGGLGPRGRHPGALVTRARSSFPTPSFNPQDPWAALWQPGLGSLSLWVPQPPCTGQAFVMAGLFPGGLRPAGPRPLPQQADTQSERSLAQGGCRQTFVGGMTLLGETNTLGPHKCAVTSCCCCWSLRWRQGPRQWEGGWGRPTSPGGLAGPELVKSRPGRTDQGPMRHL